MNYSVSRVIKVTVIGIMLLGLLFSLQACQMTSAPTDQSRETLLDLAKEDHGFLIKAKSIDKAYRDKRLAQIYQNILTLEPSTEVRTQIEYRLVQINSQAFDNQTGEELPEKAQLAKNDMQLNALINGYQKVLQRYPERSENEAIYYQLAKALDLQGELEQSLQQMEILLSKYPNTQYAAEVNFRRGDIYYSFQEYQSAIKAYTASIHAANNEAYYINSRYMSAWASFKLNQLPQADAKFIRLLDYLVAEYSVAKGNSRAEQNTLEYVDYSFSLADLDNRYASLVTDIQRVLSVSLSQQQQSSSLLSLVGGEHSLAYLPLYKHTLFNNLAKFLLKNDLQYDAEQTYLAYIELEPNTIWAPRYSLELMALYQQQGKNSASTLLKKRYVKQFGVGSFFWQTAENGKPYESLTPLILAEEVIPNLLSFSYQDSRHLYAKAQREEPGNKQKIAYKEAANALSVYLQVAQLPQANYMKNKPQMSESLLADLFLFADANYQAEQYQTALNTYQHIAYDKVANNYELTHLEEIKINSLTHANRLTHGEKDKNIDNQSNKLKQQAAFAATHTIRTLISNSGLNLASLELNSLESTNIITAQQKNWLLLRRYLDHQFILTFPNNERSLALATQAAQYAFINKAYDLVTMYSDFVLAKYQADIPSQLARESQGMAKSTPASWSQTALKQIQINSQLKADSFYQQAQYREAEQHYQLALNYVAVNSEKWQEMRNLLSSCIYFQGQAIAKHNPLLAVEYFLKISTVVPESSYLKSAEFTAANILLEQAQWQKAIVVLSRFKKLFPTHEYSRTVSIKLVKAYEKSEQWSLAAQQLLLIADEPNTARYSHELKREAQYTAAEYFLKADEIEQARLAFRTYAHQYPEPFEIAQEVRYKLSEFYLASKEPNKQYFWYRKIIKHHEAAQSNKSQVVNNRALFLASKAAMGLGSAHQQTFSWRKLTLPLQKSLQSKQSSMKNAIGYYQKVLSYEMAAFVPQATYHLGQMYNQLSIDIMNSQRPDDLDELALEEYELLLEDIAIPFEDKAIEIHTNNAKRSWDNVYDAWVEKSFSELAIMEPALFNKKERISNVVQSIY